MEHEDQLSRLKAQSQDNPLSRRDFMRVLSVATTAGTGLMTAAFTGMNLTGTQRAEAAEALVDGMGKMPKVQFGTRLGKMKVTPVTMCQDWNPELFGPALALGCNFIHKAGYWKGNVPSEIAKLPRESYYTDITVDSTPENPDDYDNAYNQVISSLNANGLKYYDVFRAHYGWKSVNVFKTQTGTYRAFQRLKKEGKVKYFGVSQHPFIPYPEMIQAEIDSGLIDAMQVQVTYGMKKEDMEIFAKASKAGIAMTAMKICAYGMGTMRKDNARQDQLKASGLPGRALLRDVLTAKRPDGKPIFQTCVTALGNVQHFDENMGSVATKTAMLDGFGEYHSLIQHEA